VVKVERGRERVNFIGMLHQKSEKCHLYQIVDIPDDKLTIRFLKYADENLIYYHQLQVKYFNEGCIIFKQYSQQADKTYFYLP